MFCSKCGHEIPDEARFCSSCGQEVRQAVQPAEGASIGQRSKTPADGSAEGTSMTSGRAGAGEKYKGLIILAAAVVFIALLGVYAKANIWKFMSAKTYYSYLESRNSKISLNKIYNDLIASSEAKPFSKDITFTISDFSGDEDIPGYIDPDEFSLNLQVDYGRDKAASYLSVDYMDKKLVDALLYQDSEILGFGLPLLYEDYFRIDIDKINEIVNKLEGREVLDESKEIKTPDEYKNDLNKDTRFIDDELSKYFKIVLDNIPKENFKTHDEDGISIYSWKSGSREETAEIKNCRSVEFTVSEKDMHDIADKVLKTLEDDYELIELILKYDIQGALADSVDEYIYRNNISVDENAEVKEKIKAILAYERNQLDSELKHGSDEIIMKMKVFADSGNNIVVRQIRIIDTAIAINTYTDAEGDKVTEININRQSDEKPETLHLYSGPDGKGIIWSIDDAMAEISYAGSGKGENIIGLGYGTYKLVVYDNYDKIEAVLTAGPDDDSKNTDLLKLRICRDDEMLIGFNGIARDLTDKSMLVFDSSKAIDAANLDEYELEEVTDQIGANFRKVIEDFIYSFYFY